LHSERHPHKPQAVFSVGRVVIGVAPLLAAMNASSGQLIQ
jgi:hypothetical protein